MIGEGSEGDAYHPSKSNDDVWMAEAAWALLSLNRSVCLPVCRSVCLSVSLSLSLSLSSLYAANW